MASSIPLQHRHTGERVHRQDIQRDHLSLVTDDIRGQLRPAAGGGPEIDHHHPLLQQMVLFVDLQQLEAGTRAITQLLGTLDVLIIEMLLEPAPTAFTTCHGDSP